MVQLGHVGSGLRFSADSMLMSTVTALVYTPPAAQGSSFPTSLPVPVAVVFDDNHSKWGEMESQKQLRLMFPGWLRIVGTFSDIYF